MSVDINYAKALKNRQRVAKTSKRVKYTQSYVASGMKKLKGYSHQGLSTKA